MLDNERLIASFLVGFARQLAGAIPEEQMRIRKGAHCPAWILGHLATSADGMCTLLGAERACPEDWSRAFGQGSSGDPETLPAVGREALLTALAENTERALRLVGKRPPRCSMNRTASRPWSGFPSRPKGS